MSDALQTLGLTEDAHPDEVTAAYRRLAFTAHPDRGGTMEQFQKLNDAYKRAFAQQTEAPCPICQGKGRVAVTAGFVTTYVDCGNCLKTGRRFLQK